MMTLNITGMQNARSGKRRKESKKVPKKVLLEGFTKIKLYSIIIVRIVL